MREGREEKFCTDCYVIFHYLYYYYFLALLFMVIVKVTTTCSHLNGDECPQCG